MKDDLTSDAWTASANELQDGVWTVRLEGTGVAPELEATHQHHVVPDLTVEEQEGTTCRVAVQLPRAVMSDGLQSVHLLDKATGTPLVSLHIAAGRQVSLDMAAELALVRDELDLLKRSLRALMAE